MLDQLARRVRPIAVVALGAGLAFLPGAAAAAEAGAPHLEGSDLNLLWGIPFVGVLLSIALFPLAAPQFWHHHFGKVSAFWAACILLPFAATFGLSLTLYELVHVLLLEYLPFIILLFALFVVAGGVRFTGTLRGTPAMNTGMLAIGTVLASIMGTTGAAMLLVRPMLKANAWRTHRTHIFVFFIFLVANVGGSLTPLGDPPLFLGFLKGVDFFWPTVHLFLPMLVMAIPLLAIFYLLDGYVLRKEPPPTSPPEAGGPERLGIEGGVNLLLLGAVVAAVLMSGVWKSGIDLVVYHVAIPLQDVVRNLLLIGIALLSLKLTRSESRMANDFTWFPILEVAKLFAGIFITIVPVIAMLRSGAEGPLGGIVQLVTLTDGQPDNVAYFWITGLLSSFLDNAPTYLVFFNTAGGDAGYLMNAGVTTLLAISAGAVFMGANTYIGNAPNFMVRAICEEQGVKMPGFFGYMAWSLVFLAPLFAVVTLLFLI